jgi:hypothetical protein
MRERTEEDMIAAYITMAGTWQFLTESFSAVVVGKCVRREINFGSGLICLERGVCPGV